MAPAPAAVAGLDPTSSVNSALDEPKTTAGIGGAVANVGNALPGEGGNGGGVGNFLTSELGSIFGIGAATTASTSTSRTSSISSASRTTSSTKSSSATSSKSTTSSTTSRTTSTTSTRSTTSTTSISSSSSNTPRVINTPSTPPVTPTLPTTTSPANTNSPTALGNANAAGSATTGGLSQPAMIGIIVGSAVVGIFIILFVLRKLCLSRRRRERIQWEAGLATYNAPKSAGSSEKVEAEVSRRLNANVVTPLAPLPAAFPRQPQPPLSPTSNITKRPTADMIRPMQRPMPPPSMTSMVGPYPVFTPSTSPPQKRISSGNSVQPGSLYSVAPPPPSLSPAQGVFKNVLTTYSPQLPDELPLTIGERVRVIEVYEDGWAMVERVGPGPTGGMLEKGVAPAECLGLAPPGRR
ncbi:hypothetical protein CALCODRAFT_520529 [Calocera cornea HHB12733]|uniref:SH3 domain-containing protein n=1 Tax=Calocera cornea HHB12733 TaxID=1353952 RepID=A0A165DGC2_9BASI|nr:hypothetical protein CALCODRAFT_520529 [Calocera cornea HHB12733]